MIKRTFDSYLSMLEEFHLGPGNHPSGSSQDSHDGDGSDDNTAGKSMHSPTRPAGQDPFDADPQIAALEKIGRDTTLDRAQRQQAFNDVALLKSLKTAKYSDGSIIKSKIDDLFAGGATKIEVKGPRAWLVDKQTGDRWTLTSKIERDYAAFKLRTENFSAFGMTAYFEKLYNFHLGPGNHPSGSSQDEHAGDSQTTSNKTSGKGFYKDFDLRDQDYEVLENVLKFETPEAKKMLAKNNLTPEQALQELARAREETKKYKPSVQNHKRPDGTYTEERQALHNKIKADLLKGREASQDPNLLLTGGYFGAGKSTVLKDSAYAGYEESYVMLDSDAIKVKLGTADGLSGNDLGIAAYSYQEEAMDVYTSTFKDALSQRMNIGIDGSMQDQARMFRVVNEFRGHGYSIEVAYIDVPMEVSMNRALGRYFEGGRFVDLVYIAGLDSKNIRTAEALESEVDVFKLWNNDVPFGTSPILVRGK